jgi:acetoin utilization protein AcuB
MVRRDPKNKTTAIKKTPGVANSQPLICERWMTTQLHTLKPLDSIAHARLLLEEHRINQLPVMKNGVLVGIVTDRDLRDAVNAVTTSAKAAGTAESAPQAADEIPLEAVMTHPVITLAPHSTVVTAAMVMRRERIGSVLIVDKDHLAGILTRSDVLDAFVARENARHERADQTLNAMGSGPRTGVLDERQT